ncbi:MAG: ribosomal protein S18-alanine N-acetyltransferase [Oscillospiraceae bacterium]|nr:ribosomal protein S18-alanine N-acetyltransferase [Oscillospiraceae bacterium]
MDYQIIPMTKDHVAQIAELEKRCFSDPWSETSIASELDNPLSLWFVAEQSGTVLGYVGSQSVLDEADMMNIAVCPEARRQGIALALVEALERALRHKGVIALTLEVRASNLPAKTLYEKIGFSEVGRRKNYYYHPTEDACILKKEWSL